MTNLENTNHTFAICAYKESPYLEECVKSLVNQTVKTNIIMATSTPCEYIQNIAQRYDIPLFVREGKSDIRDDWNFAYDKAETDWVTIAHQDDTYHKEYVKSFFETIEKYKNATAFITDYMPIKNGMVGSRDINSKIRRFLRKPLKYPVLAGKRFWKRAVLSLGNSICCPSVTYNKSELGESFFTSELKFNIDWDTFLKLADMKGTMAYIEKPLTYYRVHDGATSKEFIVDNRRVIDDKVMFSKFWPKWVVEVIMIFYKKAYKTYD